RLRGDVVDRSDLEASGLKRADRGLATGSRSLDENVDLLDAVLLRLARSRLGRELCGKGGRLARSLEADSARRGPADYRTGGVGDRDDGVVERRLDVGLAHDDVLLFFLARLTNGRLWCCHCFLLKHLWRRHWREPGTIGPSSCRQRCASVPYGYERWSWCAVRERAVPCGDGCPGSCRFRPCGECRRRPRDEGHPLP